MAMPFLWKLSSQKLGFFLVSFGFIWGMMLLHFTIQQRASHESSAVLRQQILDLSKRYIKALAEENQSVMDGPYVGTMTAYDLKKTLAVLLDNIMLRLGKLESKVENIYNGTGVNLINSTSTVAPSATNAEKVNVADLLNGAQEKCELPPLDGFPHCEGKLRWMKDMWRSDPCYGNYGVDGSTCSFFIYLSESRLFLHRVKRCMLRVLDSFGTEPEFNHAHYAQSKGHKTPWGKWNLNPQQFNTMFPHTPDNSFLGFVVEQHLNASDFKHIDDIKRQNQSLVYGKVDNFWKDKKKYLDIIDSYTEVHGTVHGTSTVHLPSYVKNHGILSGRDLQFLLRETKLFVGLSFPYEGPAPLEAIANGCAFLNPKFNPPKSSKNTDFFKGKPTLRELTSQHPYAEVYIGQPHVWTVDIDNPAEVERAIRSILSQKIEPYLPYEFTCEGMLQRVNAFIENQDFCHGQVMWPPLSALQVKLAEPGRSCKQMCQEAQLICEPSFFQHLNKDKDLARFGVDCQTVESSADTVVPAYSETQRHCIFQSDLLLFSCAGAHPSLKRICPCRDYMKGQVALCKGCL
ncbi:alpha-1,6-mannosylglycoprotein 6-beta-N-acetylglucosaminyltransferase A [Lampris incognitus]|uniref:alpha-1,6-mannosylglycoprotein 6-beta-N-acetylglucosaminyltransferase A n=1 Tax=Lampris incognitus TaxID=2546036 RepID=UPI0024B55723|nr:alpha-1,6-mannosylglycoprotein 6-beta-N-acetylglucosaminyltransferase A [Lampris incognitus]